MASHVLVLAANTLGILALIVAGIALLLVLTTKRLERLERKIMGRNLTIVDKKFARRAELTVIDNASHLMLCDEKGNVGAALTVQESGPGLILFDRNGKIRAMLAIAEEEQGLYLFNKEGKLVWQASPPAE